MDFSSTKFGNKKVVNGNYDHNRLNWPKPVKQSMQKQSMQKTAIDALTVFQQAIALQGQGRVREAEKLYESILRCDSRHFDSIFYLGLIRLQQSRFADAAILFRRAVKSTKKSADAQDLTLKLRDAAAHNNLGYALERLGRNQEAALHYEKALTIDPSYPEAHNNLGNVLQSLDRTEEAIAHYRQALTLQPNNAVSHNNLASALATRNRHEEAITHCEKALALAPSSAVAHMNLANSLRAIDRLQDALMHYEKAIAIDPDNIEAYARAGLTLFDLGCVPEAITQYEKALIIKPDHAKVLANLGIALRALGRAEEASRSFERAIAAEPKKAVGLYYDLAMCKRISVADLHFAAMQQLVNQIESFDVENQIGLHFALGKGYADVGDHQKAFEHFLKGNALKRRELVEHNESIFLTMVERLRSAFTSELLGSKQFVGNSSSLPVFIIGMLRSGTSLVEQILASHPKVFGAGERYELSNLVRGIVGPEGAEFPEAIVGMSDEQLRALGTSYLRAIGPLAPDAEHIIDKMPGNFLYTGLIHLTLPNARIIHTRRDPRDTALSCFSTLFANGQSHTYDLAEMGRHIHAYEKLMEHWRRILPEGAMIEVQYEELVGNIEREAKRIVEYCGLEWDDACLSFYKNRRQVRTASVMQVRQPIYSSSVGRWQLYEKELEPFLRAYSAT